MARGKCPVALHGSSDWLSLAEDSAEVAALARQGTFQAAFAEPWGGTFPALALDALVAFYGRFT